MDAAATTHPPRGSAEALVVERTRQMHRAKALEQLTAAEPPVENGYFRRMYRHAAGRSGGEFAITQGPSGLEYRYVWPDQRENMLDRLIAVINMSPREARNATETDSGSVPINERSREVATSLGQGILSKATEDDVQPVGTDLKPGARQTLRKPSRKISSLALTPENFEAEVPRANEGLRGGEKMSKRDHRSPVKEQMAFEGARASKHEEVNKDFFSPTPGKKKSFPRMRALFNKENVDPEK